jgi:hypothetical protein
LCTFHAPIVNMASESLLSPTRIEAFHFGFNIIFDRAVKHGFVRLPQSSKPVLQSLKRKRSTPPPIEAESAVSGDSDDFAPVQFSDEEEFVQNSEPIPVQDRRRRSPSTNVTSPESPPRPHKTPCKSIGKVVITKAPSQRVVTTLVPSEAQQAQSPSTDELLPSKSALRGPDDIERPYICLFEGCDKAYGTFFLVNRHAKTVHGWDRWRLRGCQFILLLM